MQDDRDVFSAVIVHCNVVRSVVCAIKHLTEIEHCLIFRQKKLEKAALNNFSMRDITQPSMFGLL